LAAIDEGHRSALSVGDGAFAVDSEQVINGVQDILGVDRSRLDERALTIALPTMFPRATPAPASRML